jgi:hypothetical protein
MNRQQRKISLLVVVFDRLQEHFCVSLECLTALLTITFALFPYIDGYLVQDGNHLVYVHM